ncbi:MAG: hypothetical protein QM771_16225 [Nitrospira sp.]
MQSHEIRAATLVLLDEKYGILYPRHSQVLSFDPDPASPKPVGRRIPGETLVEGMFVIQSAVEDVDLGGVRAEHGHYSRIWRARLEQEWRHDAANLVASPARCRPDTGSPKCCYPALV